MEVEEFVVASSSQDSGIGCWDLQSGAERLRHRPCASPPHGLCCVSRRFIVSSQLPSGNSSSSQIFFYSWDKPQVEVRSFPAEPIGPIDSNSDGTYVVGGGSSGDIYFWEVVSGSLLNKWRAHYRAVTCFSFSEDESLLISGSADGSVCVWSLMMMFDDDKKNQVTPYLYRFTQHSLAVTDVSTGHGLSESIIVSSSEDRTCKVWSLSKGVLLRSVSFPSMISCIALDPGEDVFFAGGRDGKIYIAALSAEYGNGTGYDKFIIDVLSDKSQAVTCMAFSMDGVTLVSGSEDGIIRVWDAKMRHIVRKLKHAKGPINNVLVVRRLPLHRSHFVSDNMYDPQPKKRTGFQMPPPLRKFVGSASADVEAKAVILPRSPPHISYRSSCVMMDQIKELQQQGSGASEMELERLRQEEKDWRQAAQDWKRMFLQLQSVCADELLDVGDGPGGD